MIHSAVVGNAVERGDVSSDTTSNWAAVNPVLLKNETATDTTTGDVRVGNGSTPYLTLPSALATTNTNIATNTAAIAGKLTAASNLSDVADAGTARTNLGLGSAATQPSTAFDPSGAAATAALEYVHTAIRYVSTTGNDSNTGQSWAQAKKTVAAAVTALPAGGGKVVMGPGQINAGAAITFTGTSQSASFVLEGQSDFLTQILPKDASGNPLTGLTALITVNDCYNIQFKNFRINYQAVAAATATYMILQTGPTHTPEGLYESVWLMGTGNVTNGFAVWSATTADVSGTTYIKCQAQNFINGAGWLLGNGTGVANIYNVRAVACDSFGNMYGVNQNNCTFNWEGGTVQTNSVADFYSRFLGGGPVRISGCRSETSKRFWDCVTGANIQGPVVIEACSVSGFLDTGGKVISHRSAAPLIMVGVLTTQGAAAAVWDIGSGNALHPTQFTAIGCGGDTQQPYPSASAEIVRTIINPCYFDGTYFSPSTSGTVFDGFTATATPPNIQDFTASGTWTKPAGATRVNVVLIGPGSGGGSGRRGAVGTVRTGGAGGAGGGYTQRLFDAADLSATVAVTVPTGGAGGAAVTTDDTNGNAGSPGSGSCSFGSYCGAQGFGGGGGGSATAALGPQGVTGIVGTQGGGASSSGTGGAGVGVNSSSFGAAGGPAGGGITSANVPGNGAGGAGSYVSSSGGGSGGTGGTVDTTAPTSGTLPTSKGSPAPSSGSGAASITTAAQAGAAPVGYGAGGAGGGASLNGFNSGAGGAGGPGRALIITQF